LPETSDGSSLVFYLDQGPTDSLVFPYATVINQETGDASYFFAEASPVGVTVAKASGPPARRPQVPEAKSRVDGRRSVDAGWWSAGRRQAEGGDSE
jgi:hypothetical protein